MARVRRVTFRFPAEEVNVIELPEGEAGPPAPIDPNLRRFESAFPFVFDQTIVVNRPPNSFEELATLEAQGLRRRDGRFSSSDYFIGFEVNGIVADDGVPPEVGIETGINAFFVSGVGEGDTKGVVEVDTTIFPLGLADTVKIIVTKANTFSPWLYYGNIPERAQLVANDNRDRGTAGMGAVYPLSSNERLQAAGIKFFVDSSFSNIRAPGFLPFISAAFIGTFGATGAAVDSFFTMDVLDGNGDIGYRSATSFKIVSVGETVDLLGGFVTVQTLNIIRADAFRTLDYKIIPYNTSTGKLVESIANTNYFLSLNAEEANQSFYSGIANTFGVSESFIDFDTTSNAEMTEGTVGFSFHSQDLLTDSASVAGEFLTVQPNPFSSISEQILSTKDFIALTIESQSTEEPPIDRKNSFIIFHDPTIFDIDPFEDEAIRDAVADFNSALPNAFIKLALIVPSGTSEEDIATFISDGENLFGDNNVITITSDQSILGALTFIDVLAQGVGLTLNEDDLVEDQLGVDVNTIKANNLFMTSQSTTSSNAQDYDRDGIISLIDSRLYELTLRFNPTRSFVPTTFLSDPQTEMKFWRKITPIGQLYKFRGTLNGAIQRVAGGNILAQIDIEWPDPDDPNKPETNTINVLLENGFDKNTEDLVADIIYDFQGRLFYPGYMTKTSMNNIINFANDVNEISSWFRVSPSTSRDIIDFANTNPEDPLLIVRTNNFQVSDESQGNSSQTATPSILSQNGQWVLGSSTFHKIAKKEERVSDHVNVADDVDNRIKITEPTEIPINGSPLVLFDTAVPPNEIGNSIAFGDIEFEIELPENAVRSSEDGSDGDFEYAITYLPQNPASTDQEFTIYKFFSESIFDNPIVKFNVSETLIFQCKAIGSDLGPVQNLFNQFEITYPYGARSDGSNFAFTFNETEWSFVIKKNGTILSDAQFSSPVDPATGRFSLVDPTDPEQDTVTAEFTSIGGGQVNLKVGSRLSIRTLSGAYFSSTGTPKIKNVKINESVESLESLERVEGHFSSTSQGDSLYLLTPAFGFVALSGHGWLLNPDSNSTAGGAFNTRVIADLIGPILFFDAFEDKTVGTFGSTGFPTVDIVNTNLINIQGSPFVEILALIFEAPPPPDVEKISCYKSPVTGRLTLVFSNNGTLEQRYSFTDFVDNDTGEGWQFIKKSLRRYVPIHSQRVRFYERTLTSGEENGSIVFDIAEEGIVPLPPDVQGPPNPPVDLTDNILVEMNVEYENDDPNNFAIYNLFASNDGGDTFEPFGYTTGDGVNVPLIVHANTEETIHLPNTTGFTQLKLVPTEQDDIIPISRIDGGYVGSLISGTSPTIIESVYGDYILFYTINDGINLPKIFAIRSNTDTRTWRRPGANVGDDNFEEPILILNGFSNPQILNDRTTDIYYIFAYNRFSLSIDVIPLQRSLFNKINENNDDQATDLEVETSDELQSTMVVRNDIVSYNRVFKDQNHIKTVFPRPGFADNNASQLFSVAVTNSGRGFLAIIDSTGLFNVFVTRSLGGIPIQGGGRWEDLGVNLLDEESNLFKVIGGASNVASITLSYSEIGDILVAYISTSDKLFVINIPESLIVAKSVGSASSGESFFLGENRTQDSITQYFQDRYNEEIPHLVIGTNEGFSEEIVELINADKNSTPEDFSPQIVSVQWLSNGVIHLYFLSEDSEVKARISLDSGTTWKDYPNV